MPVNFRHEAIIDMMIAAPALTKGDIALHLGYTQSWISTLIGSDAFQMRLAERRQEVTNVLDRDAVERLHELDKAAAEIIRRTLEDEDCDPVFALNVKKTVQTNMPNGRNAKLDNYTTNIAIVSQNTQINSDVLERARNKMRGIENNRTPVDDSLVGEVCG